MKVQPTARDKGLMLTVRVVAYDNGIIEVDDVPMSEPETGWTDAGEAIAIILGEFPPAGDSPSAATHYR
jgi:hypothetical protein